MRGLRRAGHSVSTDAPRVFDDNTLLLIWNRYGVGHDLANRVEAAGGIVLVAENGYMGRGGSTPKWDVYPAGGEGGHYFALALGGHNGSGVWVGGGFERWNALNVEIKPWRNVDNRHAMILPSRAFGRPDMIQPAGWVDATAAKLRAAGWHVRVRDHPGNDAPALPLMVDLAAISYASIWASSAGLHAMVEGVHVAHSAPHWIGAGERMEALRRMAWAQWTIDEILTGEPFKLLCGIYTPLDTCTP